ncbi:hypothetical protein LSH36_975g00021 [Paralvinella palmiformis]|uniref:Uncharacterized protein n=1 Tax=Paralvinella palmiformis TaxID=53620 RepID=A0AAD9IX46_9ANNE|nr:hypothetical protein LSH36_975g00021 [Paralvinella palmiformis]
MLSCTRPNHVLHYPLGPFTHTIAMSLDQQLDQSGSTFPESSKTRIQHPCKVSLVGCDDCLLEVSIRDARNHWDCGHVFLREADEDKRQVALAVAWINSRENICLKNCSYLLVYEPAYRDLNMTYFRSAINNIVTYTSTSSRVTIETCYNGGSKSPSPLDIRISTRRKIQEFRGSAADAITFMKLITRRNIPCLSITDTTSGLSYTHQDPVLLMVFEPDITSTASAVRSANFGFRAAFEFMSDCGGHIRYVAGGTMLYRASHWTSGSKHDCIWVLHKSSAFKHIQLHLWNMSLYAFEDDLSVTIRNGLTSISEIARDYTTPNTSSARIQQNITSLPVGIYSNDKGFYIRLRGTVYQNDTFLFTFVSYNDPINSTKGFSCRKDKEFYCPGILGNPGMCMDRHFLCDGHAHCPGAEDESSICTYGHVAPEDDPEGVVLEPICRQKEFRCFSGSRCIPRSALCDQWRDCPDGSDEYYCESNTSSSNPESRTCNNGSRLCQDVCVRDEEVCVNKRCVLIWYNYGCDIFGVSEPVVEIEWSLILPLCFAIFCIFILLGVVLIRLRRQPKFYIDPSRRTRRCRRVPIVSRVIRCHTPCSATSSCSGGSGMGLLSRSTSASGGSSVVDSRTMSPALFGQYLGSPAFDVSVSPSRLDHSPCSSSVSQEPNTIFNFDRIQTSIT